ncbi:hypothetical protein LTR67_005102 [Exophiala xenobiotica]
MPKIIGVDVGGTNTDAVLVDVEKRTTQSLQSILNSHKTPTTSDTTDGITTAIEAVTSNLSEAQKQDIVAVNIGTTVFIIPQSPSSKLEMLEIQPHFINAVVERDARKLVRVAVLRLCGPYSREVAPFAGLPPDLRTLVGGYHAYLPGGMEIDGRAISQIEPDSVLKAARDIQAEGIENIAVIGTYAPTDLVHRQEETVKDLLRSALGDKVNITLSHQVAGIGFLERENASILNAAILPSARRTIRQFQKAAQKLAIAAPLFLTQNDGTLITADDAAKLPIRTFLSGPTNSLTGAGYLAHVVASSKGFGGSEALVLDIGGTTSDVCVLEKSGRPRPASAFSTLAGVRTNFSLPDVRSIGVGGGSLIRTSGDALHVGPDSVGQNLLSQARVFGGDQLTATDVAVAAGVPGIGDASLVRDLPSDVVTRSMRHVKSLLEMVIDEMKTSEEDVPLILVGGGSVICPDTLKGVSQLIRPDFSNVANAIGAAMAKVSGLEDTIVNTESGDKRSEEDYMTGAREAALSKARSNGAESPEVVEETVLPIPYAIAGARRIIVRAIGPLSAAHREAAVDWDQAIDEEDVGQQESGEKTSPQKVFQQIDEAPRIDLRTYRPTVEADRHWKLSTTDLDWIAQGCGILGCGGGGDTHSSHLSARQLLESGGAVAYVVDPQDLPDDGFIPAVAFMGSPSTFSERIPSGDELQRSVDAALQSQGLNRSSHLTAIMSLEIGGSNGLRGIQAAIWTGKPVVDADLMGRAYPNLWQVTPNNAGILLTPTAASDAKGNTVVHLRTASNRDVEDILRPVCVQMGQAAGISLGALTGDQVKRNAAQRSISLAWYIGRAICLATLEKRDIVDSILSTYPGKLIVTGKIVRVVRDVVAGFTQGFVELVPLLDSEEKQTKTRIRITFQNENIHAVDLATEQSLASVPDLITILGTEDGQAIGAQDYRYGLRVHVVGLVGSPQWTSGAGLENGGPRAFGLDIPYTPAATFEKAPSVIERFSGSK